MINNEILSFIKDQFAQGTTKDKVKDMLVGQGGWDEKDVEEAFETINFSGTSYPSVLKNAVSAVADTVKIGGGNLSGQPQSVVPGGAFTPASELMKAVSGDAHSTFFSPGLSHVQQPKSMEPTASSPSFLGDTAARPTAMSAEPVAPVSANLQRSGIADNNSGSNALSGLRARIASGLPGGNTIPPEPVSVFTPTIKEPVISPAQSVAAPATIYGGPALSAVAAPFVAPRQPSLSQEMGQGGFSSMPALNKAPTPSMQPEPRSVFPKGPIGVIGNPRISATPAQLAALQAQKKGGRFLLGLMMFVVGIVIGGISMNAYMNGYIKTAALNGIVEKGMNLIGLGTVTPPPVSEKAPVTGTAPSGGS